jgi:hypothetical protein
VASGIAIQAAAQTAANNGLALRRPTAALALRGFAAPGHLAFGSASLTLKRYVTFSLSSVSKFGGTDEGIEVSAGGLAQSRRG